jgi:acyl-CoA thioester hydrolase
MGTISADRRAYTTRWQVRTYELDRNGHVNNAVYLNWAEQLAFEHVEVTGFGMEWMLAHRGAWVVRRHEITYRIPARYGDELQLTTRAVSLKGARGQRETTIIRASDGAVVAEAQTEWVWVGLPEGRPARVPDELVRFFIPSPND